MSWTERKVCVMKQSAKLVVAIAVVISMGLLAVPITLADGGSHGGYSGGSHGGGYSGGNHGGFPGGNHGGFSGWDHGRNLPGGNHGDFTMDTGVVTMMDIGVILVPLGVHVLLLRRAVLLRLLRISDLCTTTRRLCTITLRLWLFPVCRHRCQCVEIHGRLSTATRVSP